MEPTAKPLETKSTAQNDSQKAGLAVEDAFLAGGYARLCHFKSPMWKACWDQLEPISTLFNELVWGDGRHGYTWPLDPLHCWSRIWEYPFVAAHLARFQRLQAGSEDPRNPLGDTSLKVLDLGAAVTFFSAYLAQQGFELTNFDYDSTMQQHFSRAFDRLRAASKFRFMPDYKIGDARDTQLPSQSFDAVICVSVLEHIPSPERVVAECVRLLRPGGLLVLTLDVKLSGSYEGLTHFELESLVNQLNNELTALTNQDLDLPSDALHMKNSPLPVSNSHGPFGIKRIVRPIRRAFRLKWPFPPSGNLCVFGGAWQKPKKGAKS